MLALAGSAAAVSSSTSLMASLGSMPCSWSFSISERTRSSISSAPSGRSAFRSIVAPVLSVTLALCSTVANALPRTTSATNMFACPDCTTCWAN